jgi:hypothetical protein
MTTTKMIMKWQNLESFQPSKHYSQLATMILGNNLFDMASLPQERAQPVYVRLLLNYHQATAFLLFAQIKAGCDQFMTNNNLVVDISHT